MAASLAPAPRLPPPSGTVALLAGLVAALATIAALVGLLSSAGPGPFPFTSVHGQTVVIYGQGLYRHDSLFTGAANRGLDAITLALAVPLLLAALRSYWRRSPRGALLLAGCLGYFLYVYASMALGVSWNPLFLLYVALLGASAFALIRLLGGRELRQAAPALLSGAPRRGPAIFLVAAGLVTLLVWLSPLMVALLQGQAPKLLDHNTTMFTYALDLAIIVPATLVAGVLIWRRDPLGHLLAMPLLGVIVLLAPVIAATTISQLRAGITFTTAELVGPIASFALLGALATWVLRAIVGAVPHQGTLLARPRGEDSHPTTTVSQRP